MQKLVRYCAFAAATLALAVATSSQAAEYQLDIGVTVSAQDPLFQGLDFFASEVEKRTNGDVTVRLFPSGQLGNDEDIIEQARSGANAAVLVDGGRLAVYVPELAILTAPYLLDSTDEMRTLVTSDVFEEWSDSLVETGGLRILSFNWFSGQRHLLTKKAIDSPADLDGVRMRTPGAPVWMETIRAMGATPTPMDWSEVYGALEVGAIDAAEAQITATYGSNLHEVVTHMTKTGHFFLFTGLIAGEAWYSSLPPEYQAIVSEVAFEAGNVGTAATEAAIDEFSKNMMASGLEIVETDTAPYKEATSIVYENLGLTDVRTRVMEVLE